MAKHVAGKVYFLLVAACGLRIKRFTLAALPFQRTSCVPEHMTVLCPHQARREAKEQVRQQRLAAEEAERVRVSNPASAVLPHHSPSLMILQGH